MDTGTTPTPAPAGESSPLRVLLDWIDGRKTYIVVTAAIVYLIGADVGWWPYNEQILAVLGFGGLASLRAGIKKTSP